MQQLLMDQLPSQKRSESTSSTTQHRYLLRERRPIGQMNLQAFTSTLPVEPHTWKEVMDGPQREEWMTAAKDEWKALEEQAVFEKVDMPKGQNPLDTKWVFKVKTKGDGTLERFKMRLVARGFRQIFPLDYNETLAPIGKNITARALLAIATAYEIHGMDISNAFLHGDLKEEV